MKFNYLAKELGGLGMAALLGSFQSTLDVQVAHYDPSSDPSRPEFFGRVIIVFWHEYIAVPFSLMGNCNVAMLTSRHRDADWLSRAAAHLGYGVVRGSTNRGGAEALRELKRKSRDWSLTISPDGPMGPPRKMELGAVYLSSRLGIPLVPLGVGYDRPWRMNTWDRFAVPRPYSRTRMIWGPRLQIPPRIKREELEHYRQQVEQVITYLTTDAEHWAESGTRRQNQSRFQRATNQRRFDLVSPVEGPHYSSRSSSSTGQRSASASNLFSGTPKPGNSGVS